MHEHTLGVIHSFLVHNRERDDCGAYTFAKKCRFLGAAASRRLGQVLTTIYSSAKCSGKLHRNIPNFLPPSLHVDLDEELITEKCTRYSIIC